MTGFFSNPPTDGQSNGSSFFNGAVVPPEANSTDKLLDTLTEQVQTVTDDRVRSEAAATTATAAANNAKISESNTSGLAQQANDTLAQANTALAAANAAVTTSTAKAAEATTQAAASSSSAAASEASRVASGVSATASEASKVTSGTSADASAASASASATSAAQALASKNASATSEANSAASAASALASKNAASTSEGNSSASAAASAASSTTSTTKAGESSASAAASAASAAASAGSATASASSATASAGSATAAAATAANLNAYKAIPITSPAVTVSPTDFLNGVLAFTGVLTADSVVTVPATSHPFMALNQTTGSYKLTVKMSGGTADTTVVQGYAGNLVCDGITGVYAASSAGGNANAQMTFVKPAAGASFVSFPHTPGFAWLMMRGVFLKYGEDYTDDATGFTLIGFTADGTENYGIFSLNAISIANAMLAASPVIASGSLTFADGSQQSTALAGRNRIINGDCRVAQRVNKNFAASAGGYAGPDRFNGFNATDGAYGQQQSTLVGKAWVGQYCVTPPSTIGTNKYLLGISQRIEGNNCADLLGQTVTVSFQFYANVAGVYSVAINDRNSSQSFVASFNYPTINTAQKVVINVPALPANLVVTQDNTLGLQVIIGALNTGQFQAPSTGSWLVGNYISAPGAVNWMATINNLINVTELQLERGTVLNPIFERTDIEVETRKCRRYCISYAASTFIGAFTPNGSSIGYLTFTGTEVMRTTPAISHPAGGTPRVYMAGSTYAFVSYGGLYAGGGSPVSAVVNVSGAFVNFFAAAYYSETATILLDCEL